MFESATLTAAPASTRLWSTCAGVSGQALLVGCMLLAPLVSPAVLPNLRSYVILAAPGAPPPPPPPGEITVRPRVQATHPFRCTVCAPVKIPDRVAMIIDEPDPPPVAASAGVQGGVPGGIANGVPGGILSGIINQHFAPPPPKPIVETAPPKPAATATPRLRVGGNVILAAPIHHPDPIYPPIARTARIEGVVQLEGVIGIDGRIHDLRVIAGHPFLVKAAMDAVKLWIYKPATLNGDLVEVIAPITVTFRLSGH